VLLLLPNATDTEWFHADVLRCCRVRFLRGRISFLGPEGRPVGSPRSGNLLALLSNRPEDYDRKDFHL
jgi:hypothetical protein